MKNAFSKQTLYTFLVGAVIGVVAILAILVLTGNVPWLKAAGVGTGASDINARFWNGADWDDDITLSGTTTLSGPSVLSGTTTLSNVDWVNSDIGADSGLDADTLDGFDGNALYGKNCTGYWNNAKDASTRTVTCTSGALMTCGCDARMGNANTAVWPCGTYRNADTCICHCEPSDYIHTWCGCTAWCCAPD